MSWKKRLLFNAIICLALLACVEGLASAYFRMFRARYTLKDPKGITLSKKRLAKMAKVFDAELGWSPRPNTPFRERRRTTVFPQDLAATFGDSFTYCDNVKDDETWQHYLSLATGKNVYNFGVRAYGTDQAYLKFKRDYPKVKTPLVTLGFISADIDRIVSVYRPFIFPPTGFPFTKPRATLEGRELRFLPNPIRRSADLARLNDRAFLARIGESDYWYRQNNLPELAFPYTRILLHGSFWDEVVHGRRSEVLSVPYRNLWTEDKRVREMMFRIFDVFVKNARAQGATPVIMILPLRYEVKIQRAKGKVSWLSMVTNYCEQKGYPCYNSVEVLASAARDEKEVASYFRGHCTAKANRLIAQSFLEFLRDKNLMPAGEADGATGE